MCPRPVIYVYQPSRIHVVHTIKHAIKYHISWCEERLKYFIDGVSGLRLRLYGGSDV